MAEYTGSIELISGIKPKNNGDFPLVNAKDVLMPDGTRLDKWPGGGGGSGGDDKVLIVTGFTDSDLTAEDYSSIYDAVFSENAKKSVILSLMDSDRMLWLYYHLSHFDFTTLEFVFSSEYNDVLETVRVSSDGTLTLTTVRVGGSGGGSVELDTTLSVSGKAADAKAVGDVIAQEEVARKAEIAIERARINQIASLPEGSTTGDAELADIRIAHNGREYPNAGEAVRGQINELRNGYSVFTGEDFVQGYMNSSGLVSSSIRIRLKNAIKVKKGDVLSFENTLRYCVWVLDNDNITAPTVLSVTDESIYTATNTSYEIPEDGYLMINMQNSYNWGNSTAITPADFTGEIKLYSTDRISELSDRAYGFDESIKYLNATVDGYTKADFESGSFEAGTGKFGSGLRIRLKNAIKARKGDVFSFENPDNFYFGISLLSSDDLKTATVLKDSGWVKLDKFEVTEDCYFYMLVATSYSYGTSQAIYLDDFNGVIHHHRYDPRIAELQNAADTYAVDTSKAKAFASLFDGKASVEPFLFFTDPHLAQQSAWESEFATYTKTLKNYWESIPVENIICGGDWFDAETSDIACWKLGYIDAQMRSITENIQLVVGNHDTNESGTNPLTNNTIANLWHRKYGKTYYSFDTVNTKFFVLNSGSEITGADESQYDWFANELNKSTKSNIVIFFHMIRGSGNSVVKPFADNITKIAQAFNGRTSVTVNNVSYNFASASGKVRFVMAGHMHRDNTEVLNGIPIVETTQFRDGGKPTFDLCFADYDNNTLHMIRIGTGEDRTISI